MSQESGMVKGGFQKVIVFLSASGRGSEKVYVIRICCRQGILFPYGSDPQFHWRLYDIPFNPIDQSFTPSDD